MSSDKERLRFIRLIRKQLWYRAMRQRYDFPAAMVVETHGIEDYATARDYALSDQMCGRVRTQANMRNDIVKWFFEFEEDAILFTLKFGTSLPRQLS